MGTSGEEQSDPQDTCLIRILAEMVVDALAWEEEHGPAPEKLTKELQNSHNGDLGIAHTLGYHPPGTHTRPEHMRGSGT